MITQLLVWMVMAYGLSNILVYGSIFNGPRNKINQWALEVLLKAGQGDAEVSVLFGGKIQRVFQY